jgi:hypothetical protein
VEGRPAPTAVCGHAVALAGWRRAGADDDVLLVCDPADNGLTGADAHNWKAQPRELPVHYGRRRPSVVLLPAAAYTITGAVVVSPAVEKQPAPEAAGVAGRMPDLTQHLDPVDTGLCGPTSAADLLFAIASRSPAVLPGLQPGPSSDADAAVKRLIVGAGGNSRRDSRCLAGRMGIAIGGAGATNEGMRAGLESWLADQEPGAWRVALDWLDDAEKTAAEQQVFFGRLAGAIDAGGGVILCMWPGSEFADGAVGQPAAERAAAEAPARQSAKAPSQPARPTSAAAAVEGASAAGFPGRAPAAGAAATAVREAAAALRAARRRLAAGEAVDALDKVGEAIAAARPHAATDAACQAVLDEAKALAAEVDSRVAAPRGLDLDKPTVFE